MLNKCVLSYALFTFEKEKEKEETRIFFCSTCSCNCIMSFFNPIIISVNLLTFSAVMVCIMFSVSRCSLSSSTALLSSLHLVFNSLWFSFKSSTDSSVSLISSSFACMSSSFCLKSSFWFSSILLILENTGLLKEAIIFVSVLSNSSFRFAIWSSKSFVFPCQEKSCDIEKT